MCATSACREMRALSGINELRLELYCRCLHPANSRALLSSVTFLPTSPDPDLDCHSLEFPWQPKDSATLQRWMFLLQTPPFSSHFVFSVLRLIPLLSMDVLSLELALLDDMWWNSFISDESSGQKITSSDSTFVLCFSNEL